MRWARALWWAALVPSTRSADVAIVSFSDGSCEDVQYELTVASGQCFRGSSVAIKYDCSIEGTLTRAIWRNGPGPTCRGDPDVTTREVPACEASELFGGRSKAHACLNTASDALVRVAYFDDDGAGCDSPGAAPFFDAPVAAGSCYNTQSNATSYRYACAPDGGVLVETFGAEARCAGLHDAEHALPSGACLAPGHAANPRPGAYVRYSCEADVLAGGGDERRGRLAFVLCALGFVLALGALVGARCAPKRAPAARDAAAIELATSAVVVDDGPAPAAGPVATAVELKAAPPLVVDA